MDYVDIALGWQDTPFRHQGRLPGVGLDCGGLVVCALRAAGRPVIDAPPGYARTPAQGRFLALVRQNCDPIELADLRRGDLLTFAWIAEQQHVALWTGTHLLHAVQDAGRVVLHDLDTTWRRRLRGCWRLKGAA